MAGNPYEWNLNPLVNNVNNLSEMISMERQRRAQESAQKVGMAKDIYALNQAQKQEERLNKKVNIGGFLTAQGVHPDEQKVFIEGLKGMGYVTDGPAGIAEIEMRNVPAAFEYFEKAPKMKMAVAQSRYGRLQSAYNQAQETMQKVLDKDPLNYKADKKYMEAAQQSGQIQNQMKVAAQQIEQMQMIMEPKLRESMEEKALARQDKKEQFQQNLDYRKQNDEANRELKKDSLDIKRMLAGVTMANAGNKQDTKNLKRQMDFNATLAKVQPEIDKIDKAWDEGKVIDSKGKQTIEEYNRRVKNIKTIYGKQLEPFRKDGLWHGWDGEQNATAQTQSVAKPVKSKSGKDMWQWPDGKWYYEPPKGQ